jgi:hypothetical protein
MDMFDRNATLDSRNPHGARVLALVLALAGLVGTAAPSRAESETNPSLRLQSLLLVSNSSSGSSHFSCYVDSLSSDGSFTCGTNVEGEVVGIIQSGSVGVSGHQIRMTRRVSSSASESYEGAIRADGTINWAAGSYTRTETRRQCRFYSGRYYCYTLTSTTGPFPFTAQNLEYWQ